MWATVNPLGHIPVFGLFWHCSFWEKCLINFVLQIKINQLQITQIVPVGPSLSRESLILRMGSQCGFFEQNNEKFLDQMSDY
jgi:hypothetical protein